MVNLKAVDQSSKGKDTINIALCYSWDVSIGRNLGSNSHYLVAEDLIPIHFMLDVHHFILGFDYFSAWHRYDLQGVSPGTEPKLTAYNFYFGYALHYKNYFDFPITLGYTNISGDKIKEENASFGLGVLYKITPFAFGMHYNSFSGIGVLLGVAIDFPPKKR